MFLLLMLLLQVSISTDVGESPVELSSLLLPSSSAMPIVNSESPATSLDIALSPFLKTFFSQLTLFRIAAAETDGELNRF